MTARATQMMESMGLMNWTALLTGWDHHWLSKTDVIDHAVRWMLANPADDRLAVALLAGAEEYDDDEVRKLMMEVVGDSQVDVLTELDKWRLAELAVLAEEGLGWEETVTRMEEISAAFGSPADMRLCTRYGPSDYAIKAGFASESDLSVDPLDAMAQVISELKRKLGVG